MMHPPQENFFHDQPKCVTIYTESRVREFLVILKLSPFPFDDAHRSQALAIFYEEVFRIFQEAGLRRGTISLTNNIGGMEKRSDSAAIWFKVAYTEPGRTFSMSLSDTAFKIESEDNMLKTIVDLVTNVFQPVLERLGGSPFADILSIRARAVSIDYVFKTEFRLGEDKVQRKVSKNHEILAKALTLVKPPDSRNVLSESNAFSALGAEDYVRVDFKQHALKEIRGETFAIKVSVEAPFNERNSILFVTAGIAMEEDFGFDFAKAINAEVILIDFYRDIILKRFFDNLFCQVQFNTF